MYKHTYIYMVPPPNLPFWHIHQMVGSKGGYLNLTYKLRVLYIYSNSETSMLLRLNLTSMIAFWEDCIQNAFSAFWEECIKNAFSAKTKNQDSLRTPEQILEFPNQNQEPRTKIPPGLLNKRWNFQTKTKNQEPRFPKDSWANLGSWFLVLNLRFPKDPKTPEQILVLGSWFYIQLRFPKDPWANLRS